MMKWRPWPPLSSEKFEVKIVIHQLKGLDFLLGEGIDKSAVLEEHKNLVIQLKWKGSKGNSLSLGPLRRSVRRNFTKEGSLREDGIVEWNEEFWSICNFIFYKQRPFYPWDVTFTIFNGSNRGQNEKVAVLFTGSLNLADLSSKGEQKNIEVCVPLEISRSHNGNKSALCLSVSLLEMRSAREPSEGMEGPAMAILQLPTTKELVPTETNELPSVKTGLGKVGFVRALSYIRPKKESREGESSSDGKSSVRSDDAEYVYPLDTDSLDDLDELDSDEGKEPNIKKSFSYKPLVCANHAGQLFLSSASSSEDEDLVYYSHRQKDSEKYNHEGSPTSVINQSSIHGPISHILPWRKRKLSFKPFKGKGTPLLRKDHADDGGDDIDHDRRQLSTSDESAFELPKAEDSMANQSPISDFGDDSFAVGSWEQKDLLSRDGNLKLRTKVFFASIDQRSERAAGESACTALVAVIADWFQSNCGEMPIKSQLDSLIREGSLEWRNLCENDRYRERFPDKHFDLDTVLEAGVRPLDVVPEKSFVGFFLPEGIDCEEFEFLHGAMSFDNIWEEISQSVPESSTNSNPLVYIVSWNDHFFVLKVEQDAFYIIDTLGERLFEACNQAFILKFDRDTTIYQVPDEKPKPDNKLATDNQPQPNTSGTVADGQIVVSNEEESMVLCKGKESCKEYIKNFLAAIPVRQLQVDLKKGQMAPTLLHQRLQIEFHYTKSSSIVPVSDISCLSPVPDFCPFEADAVANEEDVLSLTE